MDKEAKEEEEKIFRRKNRAIICSNCGAFGTRVLDGKDCQGLPGIRYKVCNSCGWMEAKTKKRFSQS